MKKNSLSTAIVAGVAGVAGLAGMANAVNVNPDGLGQVLLYPYYTVNGGQATLLSVVNTTNQGKAVKVRFLESLNSAEVLDFNLYLSPFDVWTASIVGTPEGASLFTSDTSCTVPNNVGKGAAGTPFLDFEFTVNPARDVVGARGEVRVGGAGGTITPITSAQRMRQGHFEIIEMGVLLDEGTAATSFRPLFWSTHIGPITNRVPNNCGALETAWTRPGGAWIADAGRAMNSPTGGLFGGATIVDIEFGRALTYNAEAIDGFWRNAGLPPQANGTEADLHFEPGDTRPNLSQARTNADGSSTAIIFDNGEIATATFSAGLNAVSAALMQRYLYNEFNMETALAAASEWVVTFPTKRLHTLNRTGLDVRPFSDNVNADGTTIDPRNQPFDRHGICENYIFSRWDREEFQPGGGTTPPIVSPSPPGQAAIFPQLCWEANVIAFNQTLTATTPTAVLGATPIQGAHGLNINSGANVFTSGWGRIEFNDPALVAPNSFRNYLVSQDLNPVAVVGLPSIGFWAADYLNSNVGAGVRANFSGVHKHRADRDGYLMGSGAVPDMGTPLNTTGLQSWTAS
jgi:hypothetical protein